MSAFYIGQRVRIVWVEPWWSQVFVGKEATIIGFDPCARCGLTKKIFEGYDVSVDGYGSGNEQYDYCFETYQLEPIIPPGLESPAEIAALYEPELVSA